MKSTKHEIRSTKQIQNSNDKDSEYFGFGILDLDVVPDFLKGLFRVSVFEFRIWRSARGFTIIETLVAIAVLLLAVSAPLTIAERGLASAEVARQEITAFYLAQEAIEYIRNVRDANALAGRNGENWLQGLTDCLRSDGCGVDPTALSAGQQIIRCNPSDSDNDCIVWQYTAGNNPSACVLSSLCGLFGHRKPPSNPEWTTTGFTRAVILEEIEDNIEVRLQVTVNWNAGALGTRAITVSENLTNWYTP